MNDSYDLCECNHYRMQHDPGCLVCRWQSEGAGVCKVFTAVQSETQPAPQVAKRAAGRGKYGAVRTNGYASKKEADYAAQLALRQKAGQITFFLEQVPLILEGRTDNGRRYVYRVDFVTFSSLVEGKSRRYSVEFIEVKGRDLALGKLKRKQAEARYGIKVTVV